MWTLVFVLNGVTKLLTMSSYPACEAAVGYIEKQGGVVVEECTNALPPATHPGLDPVQIINEMGRK